MAELDVSQLINDADFADDIIVVRTAQMVDASGRVVEAPQQFFTYGSVSPASGQSLQLLPDEARTTATIQVITPFALQEATDTTEADMVQWRGRYYRVTLLSPFSNWGQGFTSATCTLTAFTLPTPDAPDTDTLEH